MNQTAQNSTQSFAFVISACAAVGLWCVVAGNTERSDAVPRRDGDGMELDSRVNPNEASIESLARLPGLGPVRAGAIVAYRRDCPRHPPFRNGGDLQHVRGIGPGTVESINNWIKFE